MNKYIILLSLPMSLLIRLFEKYIFNDWHFFIFLSVLVALDTLLGLIKHWKLNTLSSKGFGDFFTKFINYVAVLVVTHVLKNFEIGGSSNIIFSWVDDAIYSALVLREAISILENAGAISPGLLPNWILKKLKQFNEDGSFKNSNPVVQESKRDIL